jgi:hypothetical protein
VAFFSFAGFRLLLKISILPLRSTNLDHHLLRAIAFEGFKSIFNTKKVILKGLKVFLTLKKSI